jgi:DNA mismatch repair protein MutL
MDLSSAAARIDRLPEDLINKIAAGEVVERPASVVKELVENAIDAGARGVAAEIEAGGKGLIRVRDDGCGMGRLDAERALERHATSKLRSLADLQAIATHGFRGEALPSIASVSHLVLRTRDDSGPAGTEVEVRHGRLVHVRDAGHPRGTTVEVRDLFGAVPARRKFLRADPTEAAHVSETLTVLALAHPGIGFSLASGGRPLLEAPAVDGLAARIYQVFGAQRLDDLIPVEGGRDWARVRGFVSRPDRPGPVRPSLRLYVNGRAVRDRILAKAVGEGYRAAAAGDRGFEAVLFVEGPLHLIDVNVHPAKTEVRFADTRTVFAAVETAVREALSEGTRSRAVRAEPSRTSRAMERVRDGASLVAEPSRFTDGSDAMASVEAPQRESLINVARTLLDPTPPTVLGQHRNTYIVTTDGEDLILVDQHTAHERVRFEALVRGLAGGRVESQILLVPLVLPLPPELFPVLETSLEDLALLGFDAEPFGGRSVRLRSVPALLAGRDPGAVFEDVLRDVRDGDHPSWTVATARERLAATVACHSAARAGEPLGLPAMRAIVQELERTEQPSLCPHGRPTRVRLAAEDMSRWFGRSGWKRR